MSHLAGNGIRHMGQHSSLNPSDPDPRPDVPAAFLFPASDPDFIPNRGFAVDFSSAASGVPDPVSPSHSSPECSVSDLDFPAVTLFTSCSHSLTSDGSFSSLREFGALWIKMQPARSGRS